MDSLRIALRRRRTSSCCTNVSQAVVNFPNKYTCWHHVIWGYAHLELVDKHSYGVELIALTLLLHACMYADCWWLEQ